MRKPQSETESSYDRVAEEYASEFFDELERKPFDRELLDQFAESLRGKGEVCEIGCGPGQIARYLKDRGVNISGIDVSVEMVKVATRLNPDISFAQGDMLSLDRADETLSGIVCFYTIIHLTHQDVSRALNEMHRAMVEGGKLLLSFHRGEGKLHRDIWYEKPVSIDVTLFEKSEMQGLLKSAGLEVDRMVEREPYEFEYPTQRIYVIAKKGSATRLKSQG